MYLCAEGLLPVAGGGEGKGRHRQFDYEGLARAAIISAFYDAGIEIQLAGRLVQQIGEEANLHQLANLDGFISRPHSPVIDGMVDQGLEPDNAFHLHEALRIRSGEYEPHKAMAYDRLVEIFDRSFVQLNHLVPGNAEGSLVEASLKALGY